MVQRPCVQSAPNMPVATSPSSVRSPSRPSKLVTAPRPQNETRSLPGVSSVSVKEEPVSRSRDVTARDWYCTSSSVSLFSQSVRRCASRRASRSASLPPAPDPDPGDPDPTPICWPARRDLDPGRGRRAHPPLNRLQHLLGHRTPEARNPRPRDRTGVEDRADALGVADRRPAGVREHQAQGLAALVVAVGQDPDLDGLHRLARLEGQRTVLLRHSPPRRSPCRRVSCSPPSRHWRSSLLSTT